MIVAVLFGAKSFEHEISVVSAIALKKVLKSEIVYIFCDYNRDFYLIPTDKINSKKFSSGEYLKDKALYLKNGGFYYKKAFGEGKVSFDVIDDGIVTPNTRAAPSASTAIVATSAESIPPERATSTPGNPFLSV